jgi:ABC-type amino acid transport substrate-binding protein
MRTIAVAAVLLSALSARGEAQQRQALPGQPQPNPFDEPTATAPKSDKLIVGTHPVAPFIIKGEDGTWSGISIDLWKTLADQLGLEYEIRELPVEDLTSGKHTELDVVVSLNITAKSEGVYDMTHAFYSTGLAIAVTQSKRTWTQQLGRILSPTFLKLLGGVAGLLILAGLLMWRIERRRNPAVFGGRDGWLSGIMWSVEAVIGYADPGHQTRAGRVLQIFWALFGLLLISGLTAQLSSQLTVGELEAKVNGPDDLPKVKVGTVKPSQGARYCERRGLVCKGYDDADAALTGLEKGEVAAIVYEAPILQYFATSKHQQVKVLPGTFDNHGYGFALKIGSPIYRKLDLALLTYTASEAWSAQMANYLGAAP